MPKEKMQKPGTIEITKDNQGVWAITKASYGNSAEEPHFTQEEAHDLAWGTLKTPNGYATAFLPKLYKHVFGDIEHTRIELTFIRHPITSLIAVGEISFYFDEKQVS